MTSSAVAMDVGNSRIKVGIQYGGSIAKVVTFGHGCAELLKLIEAEAISLTGEKPSKWILAGVVPVEVARLSEALHQSGARVCLLDDQSRIGLTLSVDEPGKVGVDRLLAAKAAYHLAKDKACMVVDAGTALTINWVDRTGTFQGGSIQPGLKLMAKSLGDGTASLPEISSLGLGTVDWPAKNTITAIQSGLFYAMVGAVERCWRKARDMDREASFWITGGGGEALAGFFPGVSCFQPNLVLEGMFLTAN